MFGVSRRKLIFFILVLIIEIVLVVSGIRYREYKSLLTAVPQNTVFEVILKPPPFPSSSTSIGGLMAISAVPTGKIFNQELKNARGETVAQASVLETVTKNSNGELRELNFIVQLSPTSDSQRNIMPWIAEKAGMIASVETDGKQMLGVDDLAKLFPKGKIILFIPLLNLDRREIGGFLPEYISYARSYYDGKIQQLNDFVVGGLKGLYGQLIFLLDL